jgi:hypothetical protein
MFGASSVRRFISFITHRFQLREPSARRHDYAVEQKPRRFALVGGPRVRLMQDALGVAIHEPVVSAAHLD